MSDVTANVEQCSGCVNFRPVDNGSNGTCHRYPPIWAEGPMEFCHPLTAHDNWCYEFTSHEDYAFFSDLDDEDTDDIKVGGTE